MRKQSKLEAVVSHVSKSTEQRILVQNRQEIVGEEQKSAKVKKCCSAVLEFRADKKPHTWMIDRSQKAHLKRMAGG